ncbi:MAG: polyprenyl synthetase family protein [Anaerolineae bacterium]|nr:polyprenyl synthetase family protein [Anaerolineae bacterium]
MTIHFGQATFAPAPAREISEIIGEALADVDMRMKQITQSEVSVLQQASHHILQAGGKRIRPRLLMLAHVACGGHALGDAVSVAAALELVLTASVVHDDIYDHGMLRRGRPSVNALWGRTFALLTGDFLFTKVYELMAPYRDLNITLAEATVALVEGETLQASAVKEHNYTREAYYRIIGLKTAALFRAGGVLGAQLAGAEARIAKALGDFGYNIGLAFQIIDDILDLTVDSEQLGKTSGIDLEQGRGYAAAHTTAETSADTSALDAISAIRAKASSSEAIREGRLFAEQLVANALDMLDILPESAAKSELIELAHSVVNRAT